MTRKWTALPLALIVAASLAFAACGEDENQATANTEPETNATVSDDLGTETDAAELRAGLTHLLTEHVELAGVTVVQGVGNGLDSGEFKASADALDGNSQDLAAAIGSVYGDDAGDQFLELWRTHIEFFVDYTEGLARGNKAQAQGALKDLDGYRADFGAFLSAANPNLTKQAVAQELKPHVESLAKAIDSVVAGDTAAFADLQEAASHMPDTAAVLAGAIATQQELDGTADSGASELRSSLTYLLDQHVYAAAVAITTGLEAGLDSPEFEAAAGALDDNSVGLADAIGSVYGDDARDQFLELWRTHIEFFVDYTAAKAEGDEKAAKQAKQGLDSYREDFGAFMASANPNLTKDAVAMELKPHVDSVFRVIDDAVAGDAAVFENLRKAAGHMPGTANTLATAIVTQYPEMFRASGDE